MGRLDSYSRYIKTGLVTGGLLLSHSGATDQNSSFDTLPRLRESRSELVQTLYPLAEKKDTLTIKPMKIKEYINQLQLAGKCETIDICAWATQNNIDQENFRPKLIKAAIFRQYYHDNVQSLINEFEAQFGNELTSLGYHLIITSLLAKTWEQSSNNNNKLFLPNTAFFSFLIKNYNLKQILVFCDSQGNDIESAVEQIGGEDRYLFERSYGIFRKHNQICVGYDQVAKYLQSVGVGLRSTSKRNEEDGSSMDYFRTGSEMEVHAYRKLQKIIALFRSDYPNLPLFISGLKEFGHACDEQVSHSEKNFGKPKYTMSTGCLSKSHTMGHAADIKMMGADGLILYARLRKYTLDKVKGDIKIGESHSFKCGELEFQYIFHGDGVIAKHFHITL